MFQANGGNGAVKGFGGSGGVIIFDGELNLLASDFTLAQAYGGLPGAQVPESDKECATGAAGTIWLKKTDTLIVSNGGRKTSSFTYVKAKKRNNGYQNDYTVAVDLTVEQNA